MISPSLPRDPSRLRGLGHLLRHGASSLHTNMKGQGYDKPRIVHRCVPIVVRKPNACRGRIQTHTTSFNDVTHAPNLAVPQPPFVDCIHQNTFLNAPAAAKPNPPCGVNSSPNPTMHAGHPGPVGSCLQSPEEPARTQASRAPSLPCLEQHHPPCAQVSPTRIHLALNSPLHRHCLLRPQPGPRLDRLFW